MQNPTLTVADGLVVGMEYELRLDDGELVDSSAEDGPMEYLHGSGEIIPGLEHALQGMQIGDDKKVVLAPEDAYGEYDEEAVERVPIESFPDDLELEPGMELHMRDSETGHILQAYVVEVGSKWVLLDLNHPLAGETLHFDVKITSVRPATAEEKDHGHAHGAHGHDH
ncbi:MAG: peptidylprolyl isomerase [Anaerolineales bacterium]|nr:peptidylprolyl isomerase [Anaerolineales bacterium]